MPLPKRGVSAKGRREVREDESSPASSPRGRSNSTRGSKFRVESPTKAPGTPGRKPRTTEDVRAEAFPIVPRGRGRPPSKKSTPVASKNIADVDASPSRRSRRFTEQSGDEEMSTSSRRRLDSQSTIGSRKSPSMTPRRGRKKSEMEPAEDTYDDTGFEESGGRGKRKRKLTEAASAAQAQSRSRKTSRRISEKADEQTLDAMEPIHEEMTEPIEDDPEGDEMLDEVAHEEMVHAESPEGMYMQSHHTVRQQQQQHYMMGGSRTRGMHVVSDHDEMMMNQNQHITEEDEQGMEEMVVYDEEGNLVMGYEGEEMAHEEIIDGEEEEDMMRHHGQTRHHMIPPHEMKEEAGQRGDGEDDNEDDDDADDLPPQLEPEQGPPAEEIMMHENMDKGGQQMMEPYGDEPYMSPGGTEYIPTQMGEDELYVDGVDMNMMQMEGEGGVINDPRAIEFNFLDNKHVCCGLCGEIVEYDQLVSEHLPMNHPEVYGEGVTSSCDLEEISYDVWLKDQLYHKKKSMDNGFRSSGYDPQQGTNAMGRIGGRNTRGLRRVSQVRVNPSGMSLQQLDAALKKKMVEKMGRKVKVSLVDKMHARCGICNAVVSLNKKFEVVHLVRHFNAWHPSSHRCQGTWPNRAPLTGPGKPLSCQDFAVVDVALEAPESLQCIWCGMFMDRTMLAMHFHEVHPEDVEVPKCHLCLQEVVINARLLEKYGEDFEITLPDEHHIKCNKIGGTSFATESALDKCIERKMRKMQAVEAGEQLANDDDEEADEEEAGPPRDPQYSNSRMSFGRRNKPKRSFIMPSLRQAIPQDSRYVEAINEGEWRCKQCGDPILAAVISAGAIKHFRHAHPDLLEDMQYELCKARLERVSDGCMEFVHPQLIECLICNLTYALHKPYNMCRGIRHLKTKHPAMMPEYNGPEQHQQRANMLPKKEGQFKYGQQRNQQRGGVAMGQYVEDPAVLRKLKEEYDIEFDKVQTMYGPDGEEIFVLVTNGQEVDARVAQNIQDSIRVDEQSMDGEEGEGEEGEEGVIVEEEEYQMEHEIVVRGEDDGRHMALGAHHQRHQVGISREEMVEEEQQIDHQEGDEENDEMGEEREMTEEDLVEQAMHDEQQPHFQ